MIETSTRARTSTSPQAIDYPASNPLTIATPKALRRAGNDDCGSKQWIANQITVIIRTAMVDTPAKLIPQRVQRNGVIVPEHVREKSNRNHALALSACLGLARLNGHIIEKKQSIAGKVDLSKLPPDQLRALLSATADQLAPGERQRLMDSADGLTIDLTSIES